MEQYNNLRRFFDFLHNAQDFTYVFIFMSNRRHYSLNICNDDPTQVHLSVVFSMNINLKDIIIVTNKIIKYST